MTFIIFRNYYFRFIIRNLTNCYILKTFSLKNNEKIADYILEKLCLWSVALVSTILVLGLERVCPRKAGPWPQTFFESLASKVVSSTQPLLFSRKYNIGFVHGLLKRSLFELRCLLFQNKKECCLIKEEYGA